MEINNILVCREKKANLIKSYTNDYQVVTLKANIVGENKNMKEAYILLSYFDKQIPNTYLKKEIHDDLDGPLVLYLFPNDKSLKVDMISLETNNPLGIAIPQNHSFTTDENGNKISMGQDAVGLAHRNPNEFNFHLIA